MFEPVDILGLTTSQFLAEALARGIRGPAATELYRRVFREGEVAAAWLGVEVAPVVRAADEDGTVKFVQRLPDGLEIESVLIPSVGSRGRSRSTLCVSSQVGCARGCGFCETARMGLLRNLTVPEIVGQWFAARFTQQRPVRNVVFMGMGEPLDNLPAVVHAIRVLCDDNGPALASSHVTVSTVGRADGIAALADLATEPGFGKLRLAVSINAPNDRIRSRLMPINRTTPMKDLKAAMLEWTRRPRQRVLIEYVLIPGVNDEPAHAEELCAYLDSLPCTVNVIPYNPRRRSPWPAPTLETVDRFVARIRARGQMVRQRRTRGRSMMGACGQLGNRSDGATKRPSDGVVAVRVPSA